MTNKYKTAKKVDNLPAGSKCVVCGADMGGKAGWIGVKDTPKGDVYEVICEEHYTETPKPEEVEVETPKLAPAAPKAEAAPAISVEAALKTLTAAIAAQSAAPKAPPIDEARLEAKIVAESVKAAKDAAREEAKGFMQKSVADFLRDGCVPSAKGVEAGGEEPASLASATGDGVAAAADASSWSAKATKPAKDAVEKLNKFLSEFSYFRTGVSMRLVNTFAISADKKAALASYCEVSQMEDLPDLVEKMKSPEFKAVCEAFAPFAPKPLNKRFAVFYGAPGGGKTYAAIKAGESINGGACDVVPCSPSMDAADMLYAYRLDYRTGRRGYVPTALLTAMTAGRAVVLDEVNLLPMEARMFLQNVLDNKDKVHLMGVEIPIRTGFFVLGTMNLETGLGLSPLPLPLVDRAAVVREFRTTTAQAAVGAGLC